MIAKRKKVVNVGSKPRKRAFAPYFWGFVEKTASCWIWTGGTHGHGYGRISVNGRRESAHRVAYKLTIGDIPEGMELCHHCDVKLCVNPAHLFVGTRKDNMQDWTKKGKNRLANDRSLWSMGKHFATDETARQKVSESMKAQFKSGKRTSIRTPSGRIAGTRMNNA